MLAVRPGTIISTCQYIDRYGTRGQITEFTRRAASAARSPNGTCRVLFVTAFLYSQFFSFFFAGGWGTRV